jgi:hypothetical protein
MPSNLPNRPKFSERDEWGGCSGAAPHRPGQDGDFAEDEAGVELAVRLVDADLVAAEVEAALGPVGVPTAGKKPTYQVGF